MKGKAIIFCAPSGSGKTTLVKHLLSQYSNLGFSISACTRDKRGRNEIHGKDYYFLSIEEFQENIRANAFVEWEEVYPGGYYGTLKSEVERLWNEGKNVIFDVDVKGGLKLKEYFGEDALAIFVKVPSIEELEARLRSRGTETEESLSKRLYKVKFEMSFQDKFDVVLLNDNLEESQEKAENLYTTFLEGNLNLDEKPLRV
ncbi:guanylate kinase [Leadbetterella byssophila]|uniref:Guanylate kinase n=1 Tax=Leadbetterella byssophila (strain DSM 17132 / JCM 16389 / KACC 11308 / NBRC 106382 / 4M15) TaxID=649349 RepID=E4RZG3_LEAB4|nr:guanylate kinase [Leadbetterella byssophila]ADQ17387.1 guanylate kinase [Leadbetterella byssophila DSM 17132]